jgi:hypothetical protein
MADQEKHNKDDIIKQLLELQNKEKEIKRSKVLLQRQQPWYQQSSNIIGILAIIVTVIISFYSIFKNTEKLELTCTYSDPKPLTSFSASLQEKIAVTFKGIPTSNIGKINIKLKNTGTKGLRKDDFVDGPIEFIIQSGNKFGLDDSAKIVPFLLDIVTINNSKQRNDILKFKSNDKNANFSYLPSLINKNDVVEFEIYLSDIKNVKTSIEGSISNGEIITERFAEQTEQGVFIKAGSIVIEIFGAKWLALLVLILVFLLSLLKSVMVISEFFERNLLDFTFGTLFIFIDSLFIILIISVIMN